MRTAVKTLLLCASLAAPAAHADIFMCKTANGRTLTSDRPIPECADRAIREYSNKGQLRKEVPAPLTQQQRHEMAEQQAQQKAAQAAAAEQRREDRALMARYRSEDDIAEARQRAGAVLNEQVTQQKAAVAAAESEWAAAQKADAALKSSGKSTPDTQARVAKSAQKVLDARMSLRDTQAALARVNAQYDQILQRYRDITQTASAQ
ncbi:MAG TPA: DUF4124 domain-containing protein [Oxalicibacterium sp.]|nr:DUF4124 domain-containing protein [Oxalicibacterium sp.]